MTPDNKTHYSLLCETSYSEFKPVDQAKVIEETITGLVNAGLLKDEDRKDIVSTWVYHAKYSYPTPSVERDGILAQAIPFLESHGIYSRGRFGMWKYEVSNTDHTLMQGVELANRWVLGEAETTIGIKYESTFDGRQAATHERSNHAGSGDPKRAVVTAVVSAKETSGAVHGTTIASGQLTASPTAGGGPGDQPEAHVSEEELGITSPRGEE